MAFLAPRANLARMNDRRITRRGALFGLGGLFAAAASGAWKSDALGSSEGPAGVASGEVTCVLAPEQTEGPYYVSNARVRRNISEGRAGRALMLRLRVVDASTCKPIKGASVDVWHSDAAGAYSGVQGNSGTFMRGVQRTDANGYAIFRTVYPGWYRGRTVHIHVKVHVGGNVLHTGQLYFPDAVTDAVYRKAPYSRRGRRSTRNANDFVYRNGGKRSLLSLRKNSTGYMGSITMGVQR
jgi:protocatechuate 3,4-dioxygenase beta subunit